MINEAISSILQQEAEAVRNIPITDGYEEAVTLIVKHVHELGGNLITSGMGKAGQIAMNIATTFCSTGTPAYFLHPSEAQHGDLGIVRKNDVMLLISNSGKTRELLELVELTRGLVPEMQFIVITGNPDSPLAAEATICLPTGAPRPNEMRPLKVDPPGTAVWGRLFLKMMSRMVSPMPITFLMLFICLRFYTVRGFSNPGNRRDAVWHSRDSRS